MLNKDAGKEYQTLQGFLSGEESAGPVHFAYSASLRIFGTIPDLDELTRHLGISPTNSHRRGEQRGPNSIAYKHDMWGYTAPVSESEPLHVHIDALWNAFQERKAYILQLKKHFSVDVFLGYRSNSDHAGFEIPHHSLAIFRELEVPFGVSIIVT